MMKKLFVVLICCLVPFLAFSQSFKGKKILYIDSYHEGYAWSDGITDGIKKSVLDSGIELRIYRMDTKRNPDEEFKKRAALSAKAEIDTFKPDVVIASDDIASKYLISAYYSNSTLPFVFCGVNWDASIYGFPLNNVTGMVEVSLYSGLMNLIKSYKNVTKIGFLSRDDETERKEEKYSRELFNINYSDIAYVNTVEEWKAAYSSLQGKVDFLICCNNAGITGWNDAEIKDFTSKNTKVPTASIYEHMAPFVVFTYAKVPFEFGQWSVLTAMKILSGTKPKDIPIETNKKGAVFINLKLAELVKIIFKPELLKTATIVK